MAAATKDDLWMEPGCRPASHIVGNTSELESSRRWFRSYRGFAAFLITCCGYSNAQALDFALHHLALQNQQFVDYVKAYKPPK